MLQIVLVASFARSQTLDDAVAIQLKFNKDEAKLCYELLNQGKDDLTVLTGPLKKICSRTNASPSASTAEGGGSATPSTTPSILQKRRQETRGKATLRVTPGASADAILASAHGLDIFISTQFGHLDRDVTTFEDGYDSDLWRLIVGADYQFTNKMVAGLAFDYHHHTGLYQSGGGFRNHTYGLVGFANLFPADHLFLQVLAGGAITHYDRDRFVNFVETSVNERTEEKTKSSVTSGIVTSNYTGRDFRAGILAGYDYGINNLTIAPRVGLDWVRRTFDAYSEEGDTGLELRFDEDDETLLQSRIGVLAGMTFRTRLAEIISQISFDWKHEFERDQRNVEVSFVGDTRKKRFTYQTERPDRDWLEMNLGMSVTFPYGLIVFGNYHTIIGHKFFNSHMGTIGLQATF